MHGAGAGCQPLGQPVDSFVQRHARDAHAGREAVEQAGWRGGGEQDEHALVARAPDQAAEGLGEPGADGPVVILGAAARRLARSLSPDLPQENFRHEPVEAMSFPAALADVAIASAILHFARDEEHFAAMTKGVWRVLKPGGLLFCRLASSIGIEGEIMRLTGRRFLLPDGSERFLVDEPLLLEFTGTLGGRLLDPLKTTVVQHQRSMTTWVVRKNP